MRLLNTLRKDSDKYLSHFLKYKGNTNICLKENKEVKIHKEHKNKDKDKDKDNIDKINIKVKKDKYPEFDKEGFPWE